MTTPSFRKRSGVHGFRGHLYETKLLSLLYFRAKYDKDIEQFYLATNVDGTGMFDDICFRAKVKGFPKPVNVFIQSKHRENDRVMLSLENKNDLTTYFESFLIIRQAFDKSDKDEVLFEGSFEETDCLLVMYTTAKDDFKENLIVNDFAAKLNRLIGTDVAGTYKQPVYENSDKEFLYDKMLRDDIGKLAGSFSKLLSKTVDLENVMNDELVSRYHVVLALKVVDVSEIQAEGHRNAWFRREFFDTDDRSLLSFRDILYRIVLRKRNHNKNELKKLLDKFFTRPSEVAVLEKLIECVITYKDGKFRFVHRMLDDSKQRLDKISIPQSVVEQAIDRVAKQILQKQIFKVPAAFGNKDITLQGDDAIVKKRLNDLTSKIVKLVNDSKPNTIVTLDKYTGNHEDLAAAIGNVFILDNNTKLLKFSDNSQSLGIYSKWLYESLQCSINNFHQYRFDVMAKRLPKLSLESDKYDIKANGRLV